MSNILKYQNPSSPLLNPHKIIENIPAREWGPRKINEDYSITEGKGTNFWLAPFQYLDNKGLGVQNEKLARDLISEFDQMRSENPDYNYTLDKNYQSYDDAINYINHLEGLKKYLHLPYDTGLLMESKYKPTRLQGTNEKTYKFRSSMTPGYWNDVVDDMVFGEHSKNQYYDQSLNEFTAYRDRDEKGDFISIYDEWDYNPAVRGGNKKLNKVIDSVTGGKPFVIYDRVYLDDYYDIPEEARGNPFITPAVVTAEAKKSGGMIKAQNSAKLISKINQSDANFVKRLLDPNRKSIPDWETKGAKIATHKLGWAEDDQGAYVYPEVQEIDGQLIDFSRPPYAPGIADYMAHKNNNIIRMSPEEADWFTRNYKQYYPSFKKGGRIHIKKKNRGKFTDYCGGKVTEECITRGKRSKNPLTRKRANFASVVRKWKHENGGILKYQNPAIPLDLPEGSEYGGELESAIVKPTPIKAELNTYYPVVSKYPWTGHSELILHNAGPQKSSVIITRGGYNSDYNLITNNCSDSTRCAVEQIYNEKINPILFTTPGDVRDFLLKKGIDKIKTGNGVESQYFEIPFATAMELRNKNIDYQIQDYLKKAEDHKKDMEKLAKSHDRKWNSSGYDESTAKVIEELERRKYKFQPFKNNNGGILKAQEGTGNGFWSKLWNAVKEGGMAARDAKLGAVGAQQVRDLYSEGKNQEAQDLAKQYAKANTTGIALAGGAASTGLLGDLMVTGATTAADTFIDGDTENFGKNLVKNAAADLIGHGAFGALKKIRFDDVLAKIKHPTWQKYYHGSPYPFDINNPYMGTGNDAGIHASKNYSVAKHFTEGSKDGVIYEFWAPKPSREFIDLHSNGLEMFTPFNFHKTDFNAKRSFHDGTKDSKMLFNVLNDEGGPDTVKMIDPKDNWFSNPPEYYKPFDITKDLTIDMGKIHWPDMPTSVQTRIAELNQHYPRYSKTKISISPEEWQKRAEINTEVSKLLAENGIPVVKYANTGYREGGGMSYMIFDPTKMRVVNLESPDILRPTTTAIGTGLGVGYGVSQLKDEEKQKSPPIN